MVCELEHRPPPERAGGRPRPPEKQNRCSLLQGADATPWSESRKLSSSKMQKTCEDSGMVWLLTTQQVLVNVSCVVVVESPVMIHQRSSAIAATPFMVRVHEASRKAPTVSEQRAASSRAGVRVCEHVLWYSSAQCACQVRTRLDRVSLLGMSRARHAATGTVFKKTIIVNTCLRLRACDGG